MKRLATVLLSASILLLVAGCGGSSDTDSTGTSTGGSNSADAEGAWAAEIEAVMTEGEGEVEADEKKINAAGSRAALETAYRSYAAALQKIVAGFRATEPPDTCASLKSHIVGFLGEFASITGELGHQHGVGAKQFEALVRQDSEAGQVFATTMHQIGSQGHC